MRVVGAKTSEYTFMSKRDTKPVTQHKFEAWLVGISAQGYCVGFVKGTQAAVKQAQTKYTEGSVWALSKVVFDTYTSRIATVLFSLLWTRGGHESLKPLILVLQATARWPAVDGQVRYCGASQPAGDALLLSLRPPR